MQLDTAWLLAHLPHQGTMCLLERIDDWNPQGIRCTAVSHRAPDNPLRAHGRLGVVCGIEYAVQAMAAHGALLAGADAPPRVGYLASVREVELHVARLDDGDADLSVAAELLGGGDHSVLYRFDVSARGRQLLNGRVTVVLDAASPGKEL
ncbi:3-hydroxylacyl-ACP dehydratase [uncultured Thiodictyon sp.]|uniref:3-hydroxylacyl-ACP dehydratase n=1 Tax=uncultured Thiodictyon sp. TaxID=1846217 RepID=UPI0025DB6BDB|nr:3-hydroxylacyl-ACP dehydratase [uncultured Thiodictyon sp.]